MVIHLIPEPRRGYVARKERAIPLVMRMLGTIESQDNDEPARRMWARLRKIMLRERAAQGLGAGYFFNAAYLLPIS
jgi:hypothetical protein